MRLLLLIILQILYLESIAQKELEHFTRTLTFDELVKKSKVVDPAIKSFSTDSFNIYFEKNYNNYRLSKGLNEVDYDSSILVVAEDQSDYCLKLGYLDHKQPQSNKEDVDDRCNFYGIKYVSAQENLQSSNIEFIYLLFSNEDENFYECLTRTVLNNWILSPGHNSALLQEGERFCVGISKNEENLAVFCFILIYNSLD